MDLWFTAFFSSSYWSSRLVILSSNSVASSVRVCRIFLLGREVIRFFTSWMSDLSSLHRISIIVDMSSAIPIGANKVMAGVGNPCSTLLLITLPDVLKVSGFVGPSVVMVDVVAPALEHVVKVQVGLTIVAEVCVTSPGLFIFCSFHR